MKETVGFIGLGQMGSGMAASLVRAGYALKVYNRTPEKAAPLVAMGAQQVASPAEAAESGGIVITMLSNDEAVESVTLGEGGFLPRLGAGGVHLSMSTIAPATARKLADEHGKAGSRYVAGPVFGRPDAAAAAKLVVCVSGDAEARTRVQPLINAMGHATYEFGDDPGAANVAKLCGNFMLASAIEAMAEAFTLAEKNGLSREAVYDMLTSTLFSSPVYRNYGGLIARRQYEPAGFRLALGRKDVGLARDVAKDVDLPMPLADLLFQRFTAMVAAGHGDWDWAGLGEKSRIDGGL